MKPFTNIVRGSSRLEVNNKGDVAELVLIGPVGGSWFSDEGIKESEVRDALKSIPKGTPIHVHINSEGGSVQEGLGIYNAFRKRSADITSFVDGYALSIASIFPLAAHKVVSPKSAIWMIHKAWADVRGNDTDMDKAGDMLRAHNDTMAEIYAEHTGKTPDEMLAAMEKETWIRGSAAVDFGLADETDDDDADASAYRPLPAGYLTKCKKSSEAMAMLGITGSNIRGELDRAANLEWRDKVLMPIANAILNTTISPAAGTSGSGSVITISAGAAGGARNTNCMDKIKALLKKHGTEVKDEWSDEQVDEALDKALATKTATNGGESATKIIDVTKTLADMQVRLDAEKKARVTARVDGYITSLQCTNDEREDAINRSIADETYLEIIGKRPQHTISGNSATGVTFTVSMEDPILDLKKKHPTAKARFDVMTKDWNEILNQACRREVRSGNIKDERFIAFISAGINPFSVTGIQYPQAANTITSVLTNFLIDGSATDLQNMWAPLKAYTLDVRPDGYKPLAPGILKHVTVGSTAQTNPTTYETGNNTVAPVTITPAEHSVSYSISNTDLNSGVRMADLVRINTANFANVVVEAANAIITIANFGQAATQVFGGAATLVSAPASFSFSDLATLQAALKKSPIKNIILDGSYIARIANSPAFFQLAGVVGGNPNAWSAFGWNGIYQLTDWTGAVANAQGFACNPQAIGGIIGLPLLPPVIPGNILASNVVTVDGLDIQVLAEAWFNPNTRTLWNSLRVMDGWAAVDKTAGFIVTSA